MYCNQCGKQIEPGSRFCPSCGVPVPVAAVVDASYAGAPPGEVPFSSSTGSSSTYTAGPAPPPPAAGPSFFTPRTSRLVRPRSPRAIAGVCAAFSLYYGWDLVLVRVITAVVSLFWGVGILAYIICWIAIPDGQYALPPDSYR